MLKPKVLIGLALAVVVLRLADFIGNVWLGFGLIALLAIGIAISQLPGKKWLLPLFIGWIIIFLALPVMTGKVQKSLPPLTSEAIQQQGVWADLFTSEKARPHGLRDITAFQRFANKMENVGGAYVTQQYERLFDRYTRGDITLQVMQKEDIKLRALILGQRQWREAASEFMTTTGNKNKASNDWWDDLKKVILPLTEPSTTTGKLALFGLIMLVGGILATTILKAKKGGGLIGWIGGLALIAAVAMAIFGVPNWSSATTHLDSTTQSLKKGVPESKLHEPLAAPPVQLGQLPPRRFPLPGEKEYFIEENEAIVATLAGTTPRWVRWAYQDLATGQWLKWNWPPEARETELYSVPGKRYKVFLEFPGELMTDRFPMTISFKKYDRVKQPLS